MLKEISLHREKLFASKKSKKIIDAWPVPDDYADVFVTFFKEFSWKIDECLNLSINQIRTIVEIYIEQNTTKKSRVKTNDKNITIIDDKPNKKIKKTLNQLVKEKEKELNRKLNVEEMNQLIENN